MLESIEEKKQSRRTKGQTFCYEAKSKYTKTLIEYIKQLTVNFSLHLNGDAQILT